mmetsp:Transcript_26507/g.37743  ORF Transcript_26507/g.37743 Transcript_26507/m.37743 type:complete len:216 (-) Transcript_26507:2602-3249(-)
MAVLLSRSSDRIFDGEEDTASEEEGRLSDGLRRVDRFWVGCVFEQRHIEFDRNVQKAWQFVGAWTLREHPSRLHPRVFLVTSDQFLYGTPADPLDECALHLPDINSRVDAPANIHHDVCAQDGVVSSQNIHFHHSQGHPETEVGERLAPLRFVLLGEIVAHVRHFEEALSRQVDSGEVGFVSELGERQARVRLPQRFQPPLDLVAGVQHSSSVDV